MDVGIQENGAKDDFKASDLSTWKDGVLYTEIRKAVLKSELAGLKGSSGAVLDMLCVDVSDL